MRLPDEMIVCSRVRWPFEDMVAGAAGRFPVRHDFGFDVPALAPAATVAWWTPAEHAARLLRAGVEMHLSAPGPTWLAEAPEHITGRPVWAGTVADLARAPRSGWAKPAEAKIDDLPAAWYDDTADFAAAVRQAGLPGDAWVQVSPARLDLAEEHRCYVRAGVVRTASPYLLADGSTWEPGFDERTDLHHAEARAFARHVVGDLGEGQPGAYVLDVGLVASGAWVVVEANPAWCSGTYGADLVEAVDTVVASSATRLAGTGGASPHGRWAWRPDPCLVAAAERKPSLRRAPDGPCLRAGA